MTRSLRSVGNVGLATAIALIILNLAHPFDGTTEMYGDAVLFISKMDTWWVIDHLALAIVFLFVPWVAWAWVQTFQDELAQLWGGLAWMTLLIGTAIGVLHVGDRSRALSDVDPRSKWRGRALNARPLHSCP